MKRMLALLAACLAAVTASAAPVATAPAASVPGDGLTATWVDSGSVHNLADALAAYGDPSFTTFSQNVPFINHTDGCCTTHTGGSLLQPAFDDDFVVRYTGYLNVVSAGDYGFRAFTDDGFQFALGGEVILAYPWDRGPADSVASIYLDPGLYVLDFLVWEQGGLFVSELDWMTPGATGWALVPTAALFTAAPDGVPEPGTLLLLATAVGGLAVSLRRWSPV